MARSRFSAVRKAPLEEQASTLPPDVRRLGSLDVGFKPMFGGQGLYLDGHFFGLSYDGRLYFRTDAASRADYLAHGMAPLQSSHGADRPVAGRHYEVPSDVRADASLLYQWATRAAATTR